MEQSSLWWRLGRKDSRLELDRQETCFNSQTHRGVRDMIVWKNTLCSASYDSTIILWRGPIWKPSTHSLFPSSARQQVVTVLMIAAKKQDGTPIHPESHLHTLPKDILFEILGYVILFL